MCRRTSSLGALNRLLVDLRRENASRVRWPRSASSPRGWRTDRHAAVVVSGHLQLGAAAEGSCRPGLRDRLEVAVREIARIGRIVRDYLDSTRSLEPQRKPSSLNQILVRGGRGDRRARPHPARAHQPDLAQDPPDFVTDPGLFRQILVNLLTNALDAVERGGNVSVVARTSEDNGWSP